MIPPSRVHGRVHDPDQCAPDEPSALASDELRVLVQPLNAKHTCLAATNELPFGSHGSPGAIRGVFYGTEVEKNSTPQVNGRLPMVTVPQFPNSSGK